jgi:hypothetical protein
MTAISEICSIGERVHACTLGCAGVRCEPGTGFQPRGPLLSRADSPEAGVLIVGMNPGRASAPEVEQLAQELGHAAWNTWAQRHVAGGNHYVDRLFRLVDALGVDGPVIWSNVAKCETIEEARGVPLNTLRTCAFRFLLHELRTLPLSWRIVAAGRDAFVALSYLAAERTVLGVPHPTGAYPTFRRLFDENWRLRDQIERLTKTQIDESVPSAVWLGSAIAS